MRRFFALLWFCAVLGASLHVGVSVYRGLPLQTDILSLLPSEERDVVVQEAKDRVTQELMQRIVLLVSHEDPQRARLGAALLQDQLTSKKFLQPVSDVPSMERIRALGSAYFPYRTGLLSEDDREQLASGRADSIVTRALSQVYGVSGAVDGRLLARDPFLLFPAFLAALPLPVSKLKLIDGWLTVEEGGKTHVLMTGVLSGASMSLAFQQSFVAEVDQAVASMDDVSVLRLGAIFFAHASASSALRETASLTIISLACTVLLLLLVFRSLRPLILSLLAIGVGMVSALSLCLLWFGEIHVAAQLFGASLIGVAVDYALIYFGQAFGLVANGPSRLRRVFPGLFLGMLTTVIGYGTLALSPFPGLHQVALFSCVGLIAAFLTVVLWFPFLETYRHLSLLSVFVGLGTAIWKFWSLRAFGHARLLAYALILIVAVSGMSRLSVDDDIRHQQSLDAGLMAQQVSIMAIAGLSQSNQFFLVRGRTADEVLRLEERLAERMKAEINAGHLRNFVSIARFAPSIERQDENRTLVRTHLHERLHSYREQIGLESIIDEEARDYLTLDRILSAGALALVPKLILFERDDAAAHIVTLEGVSNVAPLRAIADDIPGISFVDPTADYSSLFSIYRQRALVLILVSACLMYPVLAWRYGFLGGMKVMLPPSVALGLTPACLALLGIPFTFFAAMALVLVLSMGVDYAVFCAEDNGRKDPFILFSVALAMGTALLSFGLLASSVIFAVKSFGLTMAIGLPLAYLLAPAAGNVRVVNRRKEGGV